MPYRGNKRWFERLVDGWKQRRVAERPFVLDGWVPFSFVVGFESRRSERTPQTKSGQ